MGVHYPKGWRQTIPLTNIATLFALYRSAGDVTINSATSLPTTLDGPIQVVRYGSLTVDAPMTVTNRCRGLVILCDSLVMGSTGSISMTGKGAAGSPHWAHQDIVVPSFMNLTGRRAALRDFWSWLGKMGYAIFDPTMFACPSPMMPDVQADYSSWPGRGTAIISASGCGAQTGAVALGTAYIAFNSTYSGSAGNAGLNAPGGGGGGTASAVNSGANAWAYGGRGGPGRVWGGGDRATGYRNVNTMGPLGVDGYLYGASAIGTGGVLLVFVRYSISVTSGHSLSANGVYDSMAYSGGTGAGKVGVFYGGSISGSLNLSATAGGNGGAGHAEAKTFATMGW